jgi:hypothetical protein
MMEAVEDSLTQNFIRNEIKNFATFCEIWRTRDRERECCNCFEYDAM